jgi:CBS domain-containing protein
VTGGAMRKRTVSEVMNPDVITIREETGFKEIVAAFGTFSTSAAPVVDNEGMVVGIVTESDLIRKVGYAGTASGGSGDADRKKADAVTAAGLMSAPAVTVGMEDTVAATARLMSVEGLHRVPVVDDSGQIAGLVSAHDLLRSYLRDDDSIVREIRKQILADMLWIDPSKLTVTAQDGVVTLEGRVDRRSTVGLVVHLVESMAGVVDVNNRLTYHFDDEHERVQPPYHPLPT